jgi:branched-chain amino acid transport system ATP-binding protein
MTALLDINGLISGYGRIKVLHGISLRVSEGEIVAILGANGAGKSTLLNTIMGQIPARDGTVDFDGSRLDRLDTQAIVRRGLALVPERRQLFGAMSVEENLLLGAYSRVDRDGVRADIATQFALFPRLKERRRQLARSLSGGEQQMAAISRALMARPRMLLLDEPSLGLAPQMIATIVNTLLELRRGGGTLLLVEQNARAALSLADRAYIMETGRIVLEGKAAELLNNPAVQDAYLGGQGTRERAMEERIRARAIALRAGKHNTQR